MKLTLSETLKYGGQIFIRILHSKLFGINCLKLCTYVIKVADQESKVKNTGKTQKSQNGQFKEGWVKYT